MYIWSFPAIDSLITLNIFVHSMTDHIMHVCIISQFFTYFFIYYWQEICKQKIACTDIEEVNFSNLGHMKRGGIGWPHPQWAQPVSSLSLSVSSLATWGPLTDPSPSKGKVLPIIIGSSPVHPWPTQAFAEAHSPPTLGLQNGFPSLPPIFSVKLYNSMFYLEGKSYIVS